MWHDSLRAKIKGRTYTNFVCVRLLRNGIAYSLGSEYKKPNPSFGCMPNGKGVSVYGTDTKRPRLFGENEMKQPPSSMLSVSFRIIKPIKGGARSWPFTISQPK
ncbi:hypothetical protein AS888_00110 [Peribacillus simplex]|uniref:Uncharacterized protein n=1 Tax=Peribacillus simplex TaxID=1478 RepID=A0A120GQ31_9BACI|nr:hypothetical protein AS888_00110 [Peribacillus simplex]